MRTYLFVVAASCIAGTALAQSGIPERTLGAPSVVSTESFRNIAAVRELSDGRVIVVERGPLNAAMQGMMATVMRRVAAGRGGRGADSAAADSNANMAIAMMGAGPDRNAPRREARVLLFDRALAHATPIGHAGTDPGAYSQPEGLLAGIADTTLLIDMFSTDILVIDPTGTSVTARASPAAQGAMLEAGGAAVDRAGRLLYQPREQRTLNTGGGMAMGSPDTAAIVAFDFRTHATLPVAQVHVAPTLMTMQRDTSGRAGMRMVSKAFPFPTLDDWVEMPDGTLAIIRGADFHVDWIAPSGKVRSTPPIPYAKVAVTDSDKVKFTATLHAAARGAAAMMPAAMSMEQSDPDSFPPFKPPFSARGAKAASDGTIWIPAQMLAPTVPDGFYVVGPEGKVREHVHLMNRQRLVGFGKGVVYVAINQGPQDIRLARVPLR